MAYNFSFADNGIYGAEDLNKITSRLVSSGVEDSFTDGVPYNLSSLNESGTLLYSNGAVPESVFTLKVVSGNSDNTVLINPGTAFFNDGSVIEIEAGGHELEFTVGAKNYVYLKNDLVTSNTSYPVCSVESPSGDFIPLAEIEENGTITDKRIYAKGKLPGYASNANTFLTITDSVVMIDGIAEKTKTYDVGNNNFHFLVFHVQGKKDSYHLYNSFLGIYNFETGEYMSFNSEDSSNGWIFHSITDLIIYQDPKQEGSYFARATVSLEDGKLTLNISYTNNDIWSFPIKMYLF